MLYLYTLQLEKPEKKGYKLYMNQITRMSSPRQKNL